MQYLLNLKNVFGSKALNLPGISGVGGEGIGRFFNPFNKANPLFFKGGDFSATRAGITASALGAALPFLAPDLLAPKFEDVEEEDIDITQTPESIALLKNLGFSIQESIFSTLLTYALPGSLVMAESLLVGASLVNIFLAVWLVNARLYPMTVSLMPLLMHESQPRWKYYLSCHFIKYFAEDCDLISAFFFRNLYCEISIRNFCNCSY